MPTTKPINTKGWTEKEIQYLKDNQETKSLRVIAKVLGKSRSCVWRYKKLYLDESVTINPSEPGVQNTNRKTAVRITVDREEEKIVVFIQTNKAFEDYLKKTREVKSTRNLWGFGTSGKYYNRELIPMNDNINRDIIWNNKINFAVLRMRGISKGITVESRAMISEEQLTQAVNDFIKKFKTFYKSSLNKQRVLGVVYDEAEAPMSSSTKPLKPVAPPAIVDEASASITPIAPGRINVNSDGEPINQK